MKPSNAKLELVYPNTAGIDIGSERHYVAVGQGKDHVRSFGCFTRDITDMARWLKSEGIVGVVMESTGSYWIPVYEILESHGFRVALVNASHVKNAPGRKSDVQDCQWLQKIYSVGLLRDSFIPTESIRRLRSYTRLKEDHIRRASSHIQHMHKAFDQMNIKFHQVLSETAGVSSMKVMKAIVAGERSASALLSLCSTRIKNQKESEVLQSLEGNYRQEHIFALKQAIAGYEFYMQQVEECDRDREASSRA
ncbi:MAG: IS110 family transposase [Ignavibacteria bacterium]|nr:IS110 family transposase [Ignavibacteria bacterium]